MRDLLHLSSGTSSLRLTILKRLLCSSTLARARLAHSVEELLRLTLPALARLLLESCDDRARQALDTVSESKELPQQARPHRALTCHTSYGLIKVLVYEALSY
jgi:hypothetical protein